MLYNIKYEYVYVLLLTIIIDCLVADSSFQQDRITSGCRSLGCYVQNDIQPI